MKRAAFHEGAKGVQQVHVQVSEFVDILQHYKSNIDKIAKLTEVSVMATTPGLRTEEMTIAVNQHRGLK